MAFFRTLLHGGAHLFRQKTRHESIACLLTDFLGKIKFTLNQTTFLPFRKTAYPRVAPSAGARGNYKAHILKLLRHIFSFLLCRYNALKMSTHFSHPEKGIFFPRFSFFKCLFSPLPLRGKKHIVPSHHTSSETQYKDNAAENAKHPRRNDRCGCSFIGKGLFT